MNRRDFFRRTGAGLGGVALANLFERDSFGAVRVPHFPATAKNVIFLFMSGAPSQIDLLDPKPALNKWAGKPLPESLTKDLKLAFIKPTATALPSPRQFKPAGQCGTPFSELLPHTASCADDICVVRSMYTEAFNHDPGEMFLMTGAMQFGRPTMGAWVVYGLGSESENLPAFVVLASGEPPSSGSNNWTSGFLPSTYQGTPFRGAGDPIPYLKTADGYTAAMQRARIDAIRSLNEKRLALTGDDEISARIASYELAFRMQSAAPELLDFSKEPKHILDMYGVENETTRPYAVNCLLARRLVERGVRFVLVTHGNWDDHNDLDKNLKKNCDITDQPAGALLKDLKQRGMLDNTLVIWGGEFGRTPMSQQQRPDIGVGRDHHPNCFSMWLAGGGIKGGQVYGETDDFGLSSVGSKVHVNDLQATMLHSLGFDHTKLTYPYLGRSLRLTDVGGHLVPGLLKSPPKA